MDIYKSFNSHKNFFSYSELIKELKKLKNVDEKIISQLENLNPIGLISYENAYLLIDDLDNSFNWEHYSFVAQLGYIKEGFLAIAFHVSNGDVRAGYSDYFIFDEDESEIVFNLINCEVV